MKKVMLYLLILAMYSGSVFAECAFYEQNSRSKSDAIIQEKRSYEVYNHDEFTGITNVMQFYTNSQAEPILYLNINDLQYIGVKVKDIEDGIRITDGKDFADIYYERSLSLGGYTYESPLLSVFEQSFIKLDIIGKHFSAGYGITLKDGVYQIQLEVGNPPKEDIIVPDGFEITDINCDFVNNMMLLRVENTHSCTFENIRILVSYYDRNGRLIETYLRNKYSMEAKECASAFIPLSDKFDESGTVKIMLWMNGCIPLTKSIAVKDFRFDRTMTVPDEPEQIFLDVSVDNRYHDAIYIMNKQELGWFNGYDDGSYKPETLMTRAEVAYVICCLLGINRYELDIDYSFADIPASDWCKPYASYVVSKGYMAEENGYFNPVGYVDQNDVLFPLLKALGEDISFGEKCTKKALERNLLNNIGVDDLIKNQLTKGVFTGICYNFMMEYTKME